MLSTGGAITKEMIWAYRNISRGRFAYIVDLLVFRLLRIVPTLVADTIRSVEIRDIGTIYYRRNRGDIQGIREIFMDCAYRLPSGFVPRTILDLGANIGATSRWYLNQYPVERLVAVEPVPSNVEVLKMNLAPYIADNRATVIQGAVGAVARTAEFEIASSSNLGHLGTGSRPSRQTIYVEVLTANSLVSQFPSGVDLIKVDIEGGEQELLGGGDLSWLARCEAMIVEFHPPLVDYLRLIRVVEGAGLSYRGANTQWSGSMDMFFRRG